ncbi:MAG: RNA methyltransferase [Ruminococcaceae bacterium]|nr:RNA methyltransferase [Oscillospiraceae bacterium]
MEDTVITSSQNQYVSMVRGLSDRKNREKHRIYRVDGIKLLCEAIGRGAEIDLVVFCEGQDLFVRSKAKALYGIDIYGNAFHAVTVAKSIFDRLSEENAPEGVISVIRYDGQRHRELEGAEIDVGGHERIMILEAVRDPQNVGAIMRAAAAFSVDRIIMSRDCADIYNPKTVRASMGALFSLRVDRVVSVRDAILSLGKKGRRVFAAALDEGAQRLGELNIQDGDCVVIGNEGHGLSAETISACALSVYIPMSDGVESLNAATAAAVIAWEFFGKNTR